MPPRSDACLPSGINLGRGWLARYCTPPPVLRKQRRSVLPETLNAFALRPQANNSPCVPHQPRPPMLAAHRP